MKKLFENFLSINIGHVAMLLVFVFGLGISWQKSSDEVQRFRAEVSNQARQLNSERQSDADAIKKEVISLNVATLARIEAMRNERELKLQMLALQIQGAESRVLNLEQERAEQRAIAQRLSSVEAKLGGVEELLRTISRKL